MNKRNWNNKYRATLCFDTMLSNFVRQLHKGNDKNHVSFEMYPEVVPVLDEVDETQRCFCMKWCIFDESCCFVYDDEPLLNVLKVEASIPGLHKKYWAHKCLKYDRLAQVLPHVSSSPCLQFIKALMFSCSSKMNISIQAAYSFVWLELQIGEWKVSKHSRPAWNITSTRTSMMVQ